MDFLNTVPFHPVLALGALGYVILFLIIAVVFVGIYWVIQRARVSETSLQQLVHTMEEGGWVRRIKLILLLSVIAFVVYLWFFKGGGFKGLPHEKAIEQAQISREILRGHGFSTKVIRPAALWQFERHSGAFPLERTPDTYFAPLPCYINALAFKCMEPLNALMKSIGEHAESDSHVPLFGPLLSLAAENVGQMSYETTMSTKVVVYTYDRIIAFVQVIFFLLAVLVNYFTARRLFDDRLAIFCVWLTLLCEKCWDFCMTGLPQMLMLFFFSAATYTMVRAIEVRMAGRKPLPWLAATAALFGLLALTHGITIWLFVGALIFSIIYFRPRGRDAGIMLAIFLVVYGPWMVRNYRVCGNPVGLGWYSGLYQIRGSESQIMRSLEMPLQGVSPTVFRNKLQGQVLLQMDSLYDFLGKSLPAPFFFLALLHLFKRPETSVFRWFIASMWIWAVFGMAVFGLPDSTSIKANDLHILFMPLMTCYGLALILVMWSRLGINVRLVRLGFIALIFVISALPFLNQLLSLWTPSSMPVSWPPYVPPWISVLGKWTREDEIITSDMPWGVAWYADRKSLWLPMTIRDWEDLNDYNQLQGRIVGLYLTPITGNLPFISGIMKGEYKEWAPFITRNVNLKDFPLKAVTPLAIDGECIYYSDRDRWTNREE